MEPPPPLSLFSGSTRKQNVACDACRAKKIRCQCGQCAAKDLECTSNYIEQLQNKPRRPRRFRSNEDREKRSDEDHTSPPRRVSSTTSGLGLDPESINSSAASTSSGPTTTTTTMRVGDAVALLWIPGVNDVPPNGVNGVNGASGVTSVSSFTRSPVKNASVRQTEMLRYLFCPTPVLHHDWRYSDVGTIENARGGACDLWEEQGGLIWDEAPTNAHLALWAGGEVELESVALELIDSFFSIVEPRVPIFDASSFMSRFQNPDGDLDGPLPQSLLAVVLAFGAKFVDHAAFTLDREECTGRDNDIPGRTRSRLVQLLTIRAREVAETNKVFRTPTLSNVQTLILLEGLLAYSPMLKTSYNACNIAIASRLLEQLGIGPLFQMFQSRDERMRTELTMFVVAGIETALFRLRPDSWSGESLGSLSSNWEKPVDAFPCLAPDGVAEDVFLQAARTASSIAKKFCNEVWVPRVRATGVPLGTLREFVNDHGTWRDLYLTTLQMPPEWLAGVPKAFDTTMRAMTTDIMYHALWLVAERAVRDYGIMEADEPARHMWTFEVQAMRQRLESEAIHSALRIVLLVTYATEHGLLRLDPLILYRPIYDAGMFLARSGRDEALGAVMGLRQYAQPYPQVWELANDIEMVLAKANPVTFNPQSAALQSLAASSMVAAQAQ